MQFQIVKETISRTITLYECREGHGLTPPRCPYHSYAYNEGEPPSQIIAYAIISETKFELSETKLRSFITWLKDWKSQ